MSDTIKIWDDDGPDGKTACLEIDQGGNLDLYLRIVGSDWCGKRLVSDGFRASTSGAKCGVVTSCVALLGAIGRGDRAHAKTIAQGIVRDLEHGWSRLPKEPHESRAAALRREPNTDERRLIEDDHGVVTQARAEAFSEAAAVVRGERDGLPVPTIPDRSGWWWCLIDGTWSCLFVHDPTGDGLQVHLGSKVADFKCERWGHRAIEPGGRS